MSHWLISRRAESSAYVAKSIHGAGSDLAQQWARERYDELDAGDWKRSTI